MQHRMAIRAHRDQVIDGIDLMFAAGFGERYNVMYMDEPPADSSVGSRKIKAAHAAVAAPVLDAPFAEFGIALEFVDTNLLHLSFESGGVIGYLHWIDLAHMKRSGEKFVWYFLGRNTDSLGKTMKQPGFLFVG